MTKFVYASDLHLEFAGLSDAEMELPDGDVFVLAGDIVSFGRLEAEAITQDPLNFRLFPLLLKAYRKYGKDNVIFIPGNHEYYECDYFHKMSTLSNDLLHKIGGPEYDREEYMQENNVEVRTIAGLKVLTGTMWTSFDNGSPHEMWKAECGMNDYAKIKVDGSRFLKPHDVLPLNTEFIQALYDHNPDVVVTHHAPTVYHDQYDFKSDMKQMYCCSQASKFISSYSNNVKLWISGHTHSPVDFELGGTHFVSNPRGYKRYEGITDNFSFNTVEV